MSQPTVVAIMLVNGRPEMVKRAIKSFREQTYPKKIMIVYDTTPSDASLISYAGLGRHEARVVDEWATDERSMPRSIGHLRNSANAHGEEEIICHWDSDDWSHPNRIAEQVALLQSSGKQCVGYRDMLFWKTDPGCTMCAITAEDDPNQCPDASAWLYSDALTCLGTSLCYWREVWERRPFPDLPKAKGGSGEDVEWLRGVDSLGDVSLNRTRGVNYPDEPRMIASIHGGNTQYYEPDLLEKSTSWKRVPEWDAYAREVMAL